MGSLKGALINVSSLGVSFGHSRAFNPLYTELTSNWNMVFSDGLYRYVWHFLSINDVRLLFSFWKHLIHGVFTTTLGLFLNLYRRKKMFCYLQISAKVPGDLREERKKERDRDTHREREGKKKLDHNKMSKHVPRWMLKQCLQKHWTWLKFQARDTKKQLLLEEWGIYHRTTFLSCKIWPMLFKLFNPRVII